MNGLFTSLWSICIILKYLYTNDLSNDVFYEDLILKVYIINYLIIYSVSDI